MRSAADPVFRALADPTRRRILDLLAESDRSVKELTACFAISQPAISQHLGELKSARLVAARRVHREQRYRLTASSLRPAFAWLDRYRRFADPAGQLWAIGPADATKEKK
jgi:DNA-binding transcriptional ArsR family regulator